MLYTVFMEAIHSNIKSWDINPDNQEHESARETRRGYPQHKMRSQGTKITPAFPLRSKLLKIILKRKAIEVSVRVERSLAYW
jgi:hypothetical protein